MYIEFSKVCSAFSAFVGLIFGFFLGAMGDGLSCRVSTSDEHERVRTLQAQSVEITAAQRAWFQELGMGTVLVLMRRVRLRRIQCYFVSSEIRRPLTATGIARHL